MSLASSSNADYFENGCYFFSSVNQNRRKQKNERKMNVNKLTESVILGATRVERLDYVKNLNVWGRQLTDVGSFFSNAMLPFFFYLTQKSVVFPLMICGT